jgi:S1-C subfamily serine protease
VHQVTSDAVGFGFIIRGRGPVYVHTVDDHGPAAAAGMTVGEFLLEVNGVDVKKATHKEVAQIILQGTSTAYFKTLCAHSS